MNLTDIIAPFENGIIKRAKNKVLGRYEGNDAEEATDLIVQAVSHGIAKAGLLQTATAFGAAFLINSYAPDIHILPAWMEPTIYYAAAFTFNIYGYMNGIRIIKYEMDRRSGALHERLLSDTQEYLDDRLNDEANSQDRGSE